MENLFTFFSKDFQYAIGWTVIHSLWQATAIAILTGILMMALRKKTAQTRYIVYNVSLFTVLLSAIVTFNIYFSSANLNVPTIEALPATDLTNEATPSTLGVLENTDNQAVIASEAITALPLRIESLKTFFDEHTPHYK